MSDQPLPDIAELKTAYAEASEAYKTATKKYDDYMRGLPVLMELDRVRIKCLWAESEARDILLDAIRQEANAQKKAEQA